jgi:hypothetical protein
VREIIWAVLLQKGVGLDSVAKVSDVAPALCEADPITRNNAVRFLFEHFKPGEVVESLIHFSMASDRSVPGVAYRRYLGMLKEHGALPQHKEIVKRILHSATLDEGDTHEIFLHCVRSLNRFDLIRLLCSSGRPFPHIFDLRLKDRQMDFPFDVRKTVSQHHDSFSKRCSSIPGNGYRICIPC